MKMDFSRLLRDELIYELKVRGVENATSETVRSMRSKLKDLTTDEAFGVVPLHESFKPDNTEEVNICNEKIIALEEFLNDRAQIKQNSHEARYVDAKLRHLYSRLSRLHILENEDNRELYVSHTNLIKQLGVLEEQFDTKMSCDDVAVVGEVNSLPGPSNTTGVQNVTNIYKNNSTPVYKWDISFSGKPNTISVNAFLERVEEYKRSRHVSEQDVLDSLEDLLRDKALLWYRSVRQKILTWDTFVREFRAEYLGHDYQINLWEEIRKRQQRPYERVGEYFACMINMFNRLPQKPTEAERLNILRRNIEPYFIDRLALVETQNVEDLLDKCKKLEISRDLANKSKATNKICFLEPDLAFEDDIENSGSIHPVHPSRVHRSGMKCWNCGIAGHSFANCSVARTKQFCFRCGEPNVTKYKCQCNTKNDAGGRRSAGRRSQH